jgi:hypothetical protein
LLQHQKVVRLQQLRNDARVAPCAGFKATLADSAGFEEITGLFKSVKFNGTAPFFAGKLIRPAGGGEVFCFAF